MQTCGHRFIGSAATSTCVYGCARSCERDHYGVNYKLFAERVVRQARTLRSDAATAHYRTVLTTPSATAAAREVHASAAIGPLAQQQLPPTTRRGAALVQVVVHDSWMR
jgi:hypothetical protein